MEELSKAELESLLELSRGPLRIQQVPEEHIEKLRSLGLISQVLGGFRGWKTNSKGLALLSKYRGKL
ncbi:hypothetical protein JAK73_00395 [Stenotrophomonas maltophilia]|uniref:hypothetical protein n=1 Tax=Stenotrophomonas muris TaxID=2963283 RepID=UPI0021C8B697|nr:hypothetical protein [Stenotrophomonas muris]MCU1116308.1 hypothetical protein [Stenotrophomonas maltophilia]MDR0256596.1 hypothetical protein [Stenotrophomonas maltophilia]